MRIEVRFHGIEPSDALREHAERRLHLHLSRFSPALTLALVRIGDTNGPKGGIDKRCRVTVRGPRLGSLTLDERSADVRSAIDAAADRVSHTVGRHLQRRGAARTAGAGHHGTKASTQASTTDDR